MERQSGLCELALHNFPLLGLGHIRIHNRDGVSYLQEMLPVDCLFLDPARRDGHGGKTVAISDCEPDVTVLEPLLVDKAKKVMVKLSPMLDLSLALNELKTVRAVHIVAVNNECKELLLILQKESVSSEVSIHCEHIAGNGESRHYTFTLKQEKTSPCLLADEVGTYLYEPNAAILKAGAFRSLTQTYPVAKLHLNSHLYTSVSLVPDFPVGRDKTLWWLVLLLHDAVHVKYRLYAQLVYKVPNCLFFLQLIDSHMIKPLLSFVSLMLSVPVIVLYHKCHTPCKLIIFLLV